MKLRVLFLLLVSVGIKTTGAASQDNLVTTYAATPKLCQAFQEIYSSFSACSFTDSTCFVAERNKENRSTIKKILFVELAVNQYGYTSISVAHPPDKAYSVVYLNGFQGDRHPRLIETWKVKAVQLRALTEREPRPLQYADWVKGTDYTVSRECAGEWAYGGVYACSVVIKIVVKRIDDEKAAVPVCEFARPKAR